MRGEWRLALQTAETFRREAENRGRLAEAAVGHRFLGFARFLQGDLLKAKAHDEEALKLYNPERDRQTKFRYGIDTRFGAVLYLSTVTQLLGDIERSREYSKIVAYESDRANEKHVWSYIGTGRVVPWKAEALASLPPTSRMRSPNAVTELSTIKPIAALDFIHGSMKLTMNQK